MDYTGTDEEETIAEIAKTQAMLSPLYEELASIDVGLMSEGMWLGWYDLADRREDVQRKIDSLDERLEKLTRERDRQKQAKKVTDAANAEGATPADATHGSEYDMGTIRRIAQALEHSNSVTVRTKDGRTIEVTAILYDGSDWYAASGMGTYDRHGLRGYETGEAIRIGDMA